MANRYVIGIDQGTTGTLVSAMNSDGEAVGRAYKTHKQLNPAAGWVEQDPLELWANVCDLINQVIGQAEIRPGEVAGLGIANQGESVMIWDGLTGKPLYNVLVWQDTRTQDFIEEIATDSSAVDEIIRRTGLRADSYFSASKIRWLLDNVAGAQKLLRAGQIRCGTLDTWLIWKLTGGSTFVSDVSTASRTLLFNIDSLDWDGWLLELFGVPREILAEVRPCTGYLGTVADSSLVCQGVPILASLVDQPSAMVGQGCLGLGQIKATYGTGCFINLNTGPQRYSSAHGLLTMLAWRRNEQTTYGLDGGVLTAGASINWLRAMTGWLSSSDTIDDLIADIDDSSIVWIPAQIGLGAPYWNRSLRGAWFGIGLDTDRAQLVHAVLEGIAVRVVEIVRAMMADTSLELDTLRVDGGLTSSQALMQMQADLLGRPIEVLADGEATVSGVCYLVARQSRLWDTDDQIIRQVHIARIYEPKLDTERREAKLSRFQQAVAALQLWHDEI